MKTIGLVGGMSWESTAEYYRIINQRVKERAGGFHSAKLIMYSVDFDEVEKRQHRGEWPELTALMIDAARRVERAGADFLLICTNTMHLMADDVQAAIGIPLVHLVDVTAEAVKARSFKTVGLLGTRFTMEKDFYKGRLERRHGLEVIVPEEKDREVIHAILYNELCLGEIKDESEEGVPGDHRPSRSARRAGDHPGLHRDPADREPEGLRNSALRYDNPACRSGGGTGSGLTFLPCPCPPAEGTAGGFRLSVPRRLRNSQRL